MSSPQKHIDAYLEDIRSCFLGNKIASTKSLSWGQFLEAQNSGQQVGLYGTLSAAIAIKTRNDNRSEEARAVEKELLEYWSRRRNGEEQENLCQNIRLAALLLGLCFRSQGHSTVVTEIASELERRFSDLDDLWGDSSSSPTNSARYSEWSSAVVIIFAFQALKHYTGPCSDFGNLMDRLTRGATALEKAYLHDSTRTRPHLLIMLISVVLVLKDAANKAIRKRLSIETSDLDGIFQRSWFYVDYLTLSSECKRDYLILPYQLFIPILLLEPGIGSGLYLRAVSKIEQIKANLDSNESRLFREPTNRPSSLEQALAVLALYAYRQHAERTKRSLLAAHLWLELQKKREPEWIFAWFLLLFTFLPLGVAVCAEGIIDVFGSDLSGFFHQLLSAATLIPAWVHTAVLVALSAVRQPIEIVRSAIGKEGRR